MRRARAQTSVVCARNDLVMVVTLFCTRPPPPRVLICSAGTIKHTLMAMSPAGTAADVDIARGLYEEDWWLRALIAGDLTAIWHRQFFAHNYEVTSFEAMADLYLLTGNATYLDAVMSAWKMLREHWILPGGSFALNEGQYYPPDSFFVGFTGTAIGGAHAHWHEQPGDPYFHARCMVQPENVDAPAAASPLAALRAAAKAPGDVVGGGPPTTDPPTGELCGSVFWALLNQRFHLLWPDNETFVAEIERSILNVGLAALGDVGSGGEGPGGTGIRYFANQHRVKQYPSMHASCCEGQGTRLFGSLPLFLFAVSPPRSAVLTVSVDIYAGSGLALALPQVCGGGAGSLGLQTQWPYSPDVVVEVLLPAPCTALVLSLRMPAWAATSTGISVLINGSAWPVAGTPGSYLPVALREWPAGATTLQLQLPMALSTVFYTGATQKAPYSRWALMHGPTLMSFQGPWEDLVDCIVMPHGIDPAAPSAWLVPADDGNALHWNVTGASGVTVKPYWEVQAAGELFTNFPCFQ